jgi:hypothetical protein
MFCKETVSDSCLLHNPTLWVKQQQFQTQNVSFFIPTNAVQVTEKLGSFVSNTHFCKTSHWFNIFNPFFLLPLLPSAVWMPHVARCVQKWKNWNQYHPQASNHNQSLWRASCMCTLMDNKQLIHYTAIMYLSDGQHSYL